MSWQTVGYAMLAAFILAELGFFTAITWRNGGWKESVVWVGGSLAMVTFLMVASLLAGGIIP